jgi:phage tail sheath protein FI
MPEYLSPGVYVEEVSFRSNIIEGLSTTTTGFVGPTRYGPIDLEPALLTSLADFEAVYGDGAPLTLGSDTITNYMWHAVRAFFTEGGQRLYVGRIYNPASFDPTAQTGVASLAAGAGSSSSSSASSGLSVQARYPGAAGNYRVRFTLTLGQNLLSVVNGTASVTGLRSLDVVLVTRASGGAFWAWDTAAHPGLFSNASSTHAVSTLVSGDKVQVVTVTVTVSPASGTATPLTYPGLALDPAHKTSGSVDSLTGTFVARDTANPELARDLPIVVGLASGSDGLAVLSALNGLAGTVGPGGVAGAGTLEGILLGGSPAAGGSSSSAGGSSSSSGGSSSSSSSGGSSSSSAAGGSSSSSSAGAAKPPPVSTAAWVDVKLGGGTDGSYPVPTDYAGGEDATTGAKRGLARFEDLDDVSIVAAPGSSFNRSESDAVAIMGELIAHAEKMRYRIAVLDSINAQGLTDVRSLRAKIDSSYAAFYYPWVRVYDPITQGPLNLPPSGFVCGIYARNDTNRAVYKAPANEVVNLAVGFETLINKGQQDVLNPEGINCFRFFPGRGYRLWGARTASSDPEWMYVNLRRYFAYLEHSIDKGTQWVVFEPNGPQLWANVRRTVTEFLLNEWQSGALLGDKPEQSFFVKCDRTTMTQNDLDNGRLVCLVGVAPLRPAEFVIFRIGQWTADSKS